MKIDNVILTVNNNKSYLDFWEPVSKIWKQKFNIEPILYYFYENYFEENINISEKFGKVERIKIIPEFPTALQVMWGRYYFPTTQLEKTWIISDIDMLPMAREYFLKQIEDIDDDSYVHLNPCIETYGLYPSCYHIAKGSVFKNFLELPGSWVQSIAEVVNSNLGKTVNDNKMWFADEEFATKKLLNKNIIKLKRQNGQNGFRIDRSNWIYDEQKILNNYYFDCHSIRPYEKHKNEINKLVNLILQAP
jgi:hypothetical protein